MYRETGSELDVPYSPPPVGKDLLGSKGTQLVDLSLWAEGLHGPFALPGANLPRGTPDKSEAIQRASSGEQMAKLVSATQRASDDVPPLKNKDLLASPAEETLSSGKKFSASIAHQDVKALSCGIEADREMTRPEPHHKWHVWRTGGTKAETHNPGRTLGKKLGDKYLAKAVEDVKSARRPKSPPPPFGSFGNTATKQDKNANDKPSIEHKPQMSATGSLDTSRMSGAQGHEAEATPSPMKEPGDTYCGFKIRVSHSFCALVDHFNLSNAIALT